MSDANARTLLELLGLDIEGFRDCPAEDFLGRCSSRGRSAPPTRVLPAHAVDGNARVIECGRRPGYIQDQLEQLHRVAVWAVEKDRAVQWG
ncbi:hypothetical protein [Rhodococcus oryzae]|jgi:hypothetical protein|uniref:hypothetical protein n=1 Tax=Rhodococcus oryzae TaxID=2571143 RepID=UPI003788843A